jgi:hypothetical protein
MKTIVFAVAGLTALALSACAPYGYYDRDGYYHGDRSYYGYSDRYGAPYYRSRDYDDYRYRGY